MDPEVGRPVLTVWGAATEGSFWRPLEGLSMALYQIAGGEEREDERHHPGF
jgi:hypothetical protein